MAKNIEFLSCPYCGSLDVVTEMKLYKFPYGRKEKDKFYTTLECKIPVNICTCGKAIWGYGAEEIIEETIELYKLSLEEENEQ